MAMQLASTTLRNTRSASTPAAARRAAAARSARPRPAAPQPQPHHQRRRCVALLAQQQSRAGAGNSGSAEPGHTPSGTILAATTSRPDATTTTAASATAAPATAAAASPPPTPPRAAHSRRAVLQELLQRARAPGAANVYGKPFTKSELAALQALVDHLSGAGGGGGGSSTKKADATAMAAAADVAGGVMLTNAAAGATTAAAPAVTTAAVTLAAAAAADAGGRGAAAVAATAEEGDGAGLQGYLMQLLTESALAKAVPLPLVEGAMVALELMSLERSEGRDRDSGGPGAQNHHATGADAGAGTEEAFASRRWQLVVGADVGAVQYIPAVEELEAAAPAGATTFTLGTDLDFIFTGFSGPAEWLAPGRLSYSVRKVRIEARVPKAWRRGAAWARWLQARGGSGAGGAVSAASGQPAAAAAAAATAGALRAGAGEEPGWGDSLPHSQTCREDPAAPHVDLGLPFFPTNEIWAFRTDGVIAATRSRLGGLILMLDVGAREAWRQQQQQRQ